MIICLRAEESMRGDKRPMNTRTKSMKNTIMTPSYPSAAVVPVHFLLYCTQTVTTWYIFLPKRLVED